MIIKNDQYFVENQSYLIKELEDINSGNADFISHDELEMSLDEVIAKHENPL